MGSVTRRAGYLGIILAVGLAAPPEALTAQAKSLAGAPEALAETPPHLLPERFLKWSASSSQSAEAGQSNGASFAQANCAPILPDATNTGDGTRCAAVVAEDGLLRLAVTRYAQIGGATPLEVWAEQFVDATGATSAYTFYRSLLKDVRVAAGNHPGNESVTDSGGKLMLAGTSILRVGHGATRDDLEALMQALPKIEGRKALRPLLPTLLPPRGLEKASLRYALGPAGYQAMGGVLPAGILSWDKSAEAATASYAGRGGKGDLTLLMYPTPQIAGDRGRAIERAVNDLGPATLGTVKMRRVGPLLGITSGGLSAEEATALIASLHLSEEVTFDKKMPLEFHAEVKKTASLLENIAVLSGVLILAAVLLGLFLGGARAGIRVLMGKPAASEPEFLTINLRDKPKALFVGSETRE